MCPPEPKAQRQHGHQCKDGGKGREERLDVGEILECLPEGLCEFVHRIRT